MNPTAIIAPSFSPRASARLAARACRAQAAARPCSPPQPAGAIRPDADEADDDAQRALDAISLWAMPVLLVGIPLVGLIRRVKVYDVFIEGAKEGFEVR